MTELLGDHHYPSLQASSIVSGGVDARGVQKYQWNTLASVTKAFTAVTDTKYAITSNDLDDSGSWLWMNKWEHYRALFSVRFASDQNVDKIVDVGYRWWNSLTQQQDDVKVGSFNGTEQFQLATTDLDNIKTQSDCIFVCPYIQPKGAYVIRIECTFQGSGLQNFLGNSS